MTLKAFPERPAISASAGASGSTGAGKSPVSAIGLRRALTAAEEAAFLWVSRRVVARSSAVTLEMLARTDARLSRLVYKLSERPALAEPLFQHDHAAFKHGLTFVTAIVALRGGVFEVFDRLLARLESEVESLTPLASALTWLEYREVRRHIERLLEAKSPALQQLGLMAAVAHRADPRGALDRALAGDYPALRASAFEAVGRLAMKDRLPRLHAALLDPESTCRFWAAWSAVRLGERDGIPVLGRFAAECGAFAIPACDIALRALDADQAVRTHTRLLSITGDERLALVAAGIIGDPVLANHLLDAMESPRFARRAGAAFCLMAGCDLRRDDLDAQRPLGETASEVASADPSTVDGVGRQGTANVESDSLADEADDALPWPDTERLRQWWDANLHAFVPGVRYLGGMPMRREALANLLRAGNQHQRSAAALELALLNPDMPLLDVTAPAHRQVVT